MKSLYEKEQYTMKQIPIRNANSRPNFKVGS